MSTASLSCVEQIGNAAGCVWHKLNEQGPQTIAKLTKGMNGVSRDMVLQAIGWLAREDKISIEETKRGRIVALR